MTLNNNLIVTVVVGPAPITPAGFGTPIGFFSDLAGGFTERTRVYENPADVAADADLSPAAVAALNQIFAQSPQVASAKIGRIDSGPGFVLAEFDAILAADPDFFGVFIQSRLAADILAVASWAETNRRLVIATAADAAIKAGTPGNTLLLLNAFNYNYTGFLFHESPVAEEWPDSAWLSKTLATDLDVATTIWAYKILTGVTKDVLTPTEENQILGDKGNVFSDFKGNDVTGNGIAVSGQFLDIQTTQDWLRIRVEEAAANELVAASNRGEKIPFDDNGITVFQQSTQAVLDLGVNADPPHFLRDTTFVNVPKRVDVPAGDISSRTLKFTYGAVLAGAIQNGVFTGSIELTLS